MENKSHVPNHQPAVINSWSIHHLSHDTGPLTRIVAHKLFTSANICGKRSEFTSPMATEPDSMDVLNDN